MLHASPTRAPARFESGLAAAAGVGELFGARWARAVRQTLIGAALAGSFIGVPAEAVAGECAAVYAVDQLLADLIAAEAALKANQVDTAGAVSSRMAAGLPCLDVVMPRQMVGRAYRAIGGGLIVAGDTAAGSGWLRTAIDVEPTFDFGVGELPEGSPILFAYSDARSASGETETVAGKVLLEGATFKLDGGSLNAPSAKAGRPHLLQRTDGAVRSWVIDGNAFPPETLSEPVVAAVPVVDPKAKAPKVKEPKPAKEPTVKEPAVAAAEPKPEKAAKVEEPKPEKPPKVAAAEPEKAPKDEPKAKPAKVATTSSGQIKRKRPPEKTPLMIAGGVVMAAGGGMYYMASQKRADWDVSNSISEMDKLQRQVNSLVVASGAVAAVGAGTLTWGIILDGGTPMPTVRFRF